MEKGASAKQSSRNKLEEFQDEYANHLLVMEFESIPWLTQEINSSIKSSISAHHGNQTTNVDSKNYQQLRAITPMNSYFTEMMIFE